MTKIAVVIYSTYGHIISLANSVVKGIESTGATADLFQVPETLSEDVLAMIHAAPKDESIKVLSSPDVLTGYDGIMFGFPTRFGNVPAQISAFFDSAGGLWASGGLYQKPCGLFTSTGTGGGNEMTIRNSLSFLAHQGMIYVPLGCATSFAELTDLSEVHGGSPWGAAGIAGADGSRQFSELELKIGYIQGTDFAKVAAKLSAAIPDATPAAAAAAATTTTAAEKSDAVETETATPASKTAAATPPASSEKSGCCTIM
ncbi:hypothetical protein CANARDRAFT_27601 [[Candida] arabinofermentans NRRL YB-2248]|uniref:Flavodoxin-like domain-containing protein n=1 Tax=[Candida] arabinofermentans NRRL YB-2248 TaxID=983967 RepID=A0A1E4T3P9_9ASCO|nr:hypothetical protein CANARDRAFT_27601 [[Candida] arabinofermentans NRRL YB-2248]